jgi:hypothetical protein
MRVIPWLLLSSLACAQVKSPVAGTVVRDGGRLDLISGPVGSRHVLTLGDGVEAAATWREGVLAKTRRALEWRDPSGRILWSEPAFAGRSWLEAASPERAFALACEDSAACRLGEISSPGRWL